MIIMESSVKDQRKTKTGGILWWQKESYFKRGQSRQGKCENEKENEHKYSISV